MEQAAARLAPWLGWLFWPLLGGARIVGAIPVINRDAERWIARRRGWGLPTPTGSGPQRTLLLFKPEFRGAALYRIRSRGVAGWAMARILGLVYRGPVAFFIDCPEVGPGLYLEHAFATVINAAAIGEDCWINQQVTIGFGADQVRPTLGNRVQVRAGAMIVGGVHIGDDAVVGAGAVVVKDVPAGHVALGPSATTRPQRATGDR